jgi:hypothetical protein
MSDGEQQQQQQIVNNLHLDSSASPPSELNSSDQGDNLSLFTEDCNNSSATIVAKSNYQSKHSQPVVTMPTSTTSNSGAGNQIDEAIRFGAIGKQHFAPQSLCVIPLYHKLFSNVSFLCIL